MHLTVPEALALLQRWRSDQVELEVTGSNANEKTTGLAKIEAVMGASVVLATSAGLLTIDLTGADFNGGQSMPAESRHAAYLVCEFKNDDRWAFYALRP
jgi:hypothetical protein